MNCSITQRPVNMYIRGQLPATSYGIKSISEKPILHKKATCSHYYPCELSLRFQPAWLQKTSSCALGVIPSLNTTRCWSLKPVPLCNYLFQGLATRTTPSDMSHLTLPFYHIAPEPTPVQVHVVPSTVTLV